MQITNDRSGGWQFCVDRGGTFTDIVAIAPDGSLLTHKLLSENPAHYRDAALAGIEQLLSRHDAAASAIDSIRMGTTIGTNALLERRGARTVLVITRGFADLLRIGTQQRPDIFALDIELPDSLYTDVVEADERIAADGSIIEPLDEGTLLANLEAARRDGAISVAIAFVNAWCEPRHEEIAATIAERAGFEHISVGSRINPAIRLVDRGDTAVVDAYLSPVLDAYKASLVCGLDRRLPPDGLLFMQSHGGLVEAAHFRGCDSVLSGPAGGVVGMAVTAREAGFDEVIGFDMGGTSTDVSVFPGHYERTAGSRIAGCRIARPMLGIHTVAAGGGSVLAFRGGRLQVGPESAGADPGPACYRNGGPLTLTDANVLLGRIQPDSFPQVFGPGGDQPIDTGVVARDFAGLAADIGAQTDSELTPADLAEGFVRIAVSNMARAIEQISVQRGHDVTRFALACFGGAGGQHACAVADELGIETILVDALSGVLSAFGIGVAEKRSILGAGIHRALDAAGLDQARTEIERLGDELGRSFPASARLESRAQIRVAGSDTVLTVPLPPDASPAGLGDEFARRHTERYGFSATDSALVIESVEVEAVETRQIPERTRAPHDGRRARPDGRRVRFGGTWLETPIWQRRDLLPELAVDGPAMIVDDYATVVVERNWRATLDERGMLILERTAPLPRREQVGVEADPIMLEIFNNQFMHVAEQMGVVLEQTAFSVNIKERLDYSCAIFDRGGELIANAPHVPVHLGSMGDSVREVIRSAGRFRPGDAFALNAPYRGGTHLPDITVVSPVFEPGSDEPGFFVASRAHHADIGGKTPGSMPANSASIAEEGIVIECTLVVRDGRLLEPEILELLSLGAHPARSPARNLADLRAQLAANARGRELIANLLERYGRRVVHAYMSHVRANAEASTRAALRQLEGGRYSARMDTGDTVAVEITVDRGSGEARIDFTGTSATSPGNLNAPRSVVTAVVLYVLRTLIRESIPLNAGCLVPIELVIPEHSLLDPDYPAAVAGGNVETSQIIADALLAALGAAAASQGTMNNFTFGDRTHQYYETICGGCGAGPGFDGASAVHSHMTNSRLTDVEVIEQRFPVRIRRFTIRRGSGGDGRWHGGDGVVREIEFLAPMHASLLAGRRLTAPFGLAGGDDGARGRDWVIRSTGERLPFPASREVDLEVGDRIVIETPGGGGYGGRKGL